MILLQELIVLALASTFLSAKINVIGSGEPHPTNASVDLNEVIRNSSVMVEISSEIYPTNETSSKDSGKISYTCDSGTYCLSLCCSSGKAQINGSCVEDNMTSGILPQTDLPGKNIYLFTADPCDVNWMMSSVLKNFIVFSNGSIYAPDFDGGWLFDMEHHCLFRKPNTEMYLAKVCYPWIRIDQWQMVSLIFVSIMMLVTFIGYSVTPELNNLHGMVFRAYLATYIATNLSTLGQQLTAGSKNYAHLFTFFVFSLHYFAGGCALWFNVMCFNIWRTFRGLRPVDGKIKEDDKRKFISYAIYAWVTPAVLHATTMIIMFYVPYFRKFTLNKNLILWCCATLLTSVIICNTILYILTALRIRKYKKETAHLVNGVNKHSDTETQRFNLHVKLFVITGCHTSMWVVWELWPTFITTILMMVVEIIQSSLMFIMFCWKENIKRSFRKQFNNTVSRLRSTFSTSHATSSTQC